MDKQFSFAVVGGGSLAQLCVERLLSSGHQVSVVCTTDQAVGAYALGRDLLVVDNLTTLSDTLRNQPVEYLLSANNLQMLPDSLLSSVTGMAINFHDGPLPRFAGLHATSWGIINGETNWAVSWHMVTAKPDTGHLVVQEPVTIEDNDSAYSLNMKCLEAAAESFERLLRQIETDAITPQPQDLTQRTYFGAKRKPGNACALDWHLPASQLSALVRGLDFGSSDNPLGLARVITDFGALAVRSLSVTSSESSSAPGTVIRVGEDHFEVATASHDVVVSVYPASATPLSGIDPWAAMNLQEGDCLPDVSTLGINQAAYESLVGSDSQWQRLLEANSLLTVEQFPFADGERRNGVWVSHSIPLGQLLQAAASSGAPSGFDQAAAQLVAGFLSRTAELHDTAVLVERAEPATALPPGYAADYVPVALALPEGSSLADSPSSLFLPDTDAMALDFPLRYPAAGEHLQRSMAQGCCAVSFSRTAAEQRLDNCLTIEIDAQKESVRFIDRTGWFARGAIEHLADRFESFAENCLAEPGKPFTALSLDRKSQLSASLARWNATETPLESGLTVHEAIRRQCLAQPDHVAVQVNDTSLTYSALDRQSAALANRLREAGVVAGDRVGIWHDRSVELVVAMLAVLRTGAAYVPLDPGYPAERLEHMINDSGLTVVICDAQRASQPISDSVRQISSQAAETGSVSEPAGAADVTPEHACYVIYTSGSTGKPKGVVVQHRNVVNFFAAMDAQIPYQPGDSWLAVTSISFDISVLELLWTLSRGLRVVLAPDSRIRGGSVGGTNEAIDFGLFYFACDAQAAAEPYELLLNGARFADENGFSSISTPERHFHDFGGLYPNPSVISAAVAAVTKRIDIRAGSCVLPLHHPIRVAEEWAVVDRISNGRVGLSFAAGWHPNDFVIRPEGFADRKEQMFRDIDVVQKLWRGEAVEFENPKGDPVSVKTFPRPAQDELAVWVTVAGNPETFRMAGRAGHFVLTHLLGQSVGELEEKLQAYRDAWYEAGHSGEPQVSLMLHTFIGNDVDEVREVVRAPMIEYLRSSLELTRGAAWEFPAFKNRAESGGKSVNDIFSERDFSKEEEDALLEFSFERYFDSNALFGTPDSCVDFVLKLHDIGVDEICALVDFGVDPATVVKHFPHLAMLKDNVRLRMSPPEMSIPEMIERYDITHFQCTCSMAAMIRLDDESDRAFQRLKVLAVGGEALPLSLAKDLRQVCSGAVLNMYGPTETTIWSTVWPVEFQASRVKIGTPVANTTVYVMDENMNPVGPGSVGEIWIGGQGVTAGYWNRPELTQERFVPWVSEFDGKEQLLYRTGDLGRFLHDGSIECLGRVDHQVKIRGYRVELGEIESKLEALNGVSRAVVVARSSEGQEDFLAAFVVSSDASMTESAIKEGLGSWLPEFMVPTRVVFVEDFPYTPNGKIDRTRLGSQSLAGSRLPQPAAPAQPRPAKESGQVDVVAGPGSAGSPPVDTADTAETAETAVAATPAKDHNLPEDSPDTEAIPDEAVVGSDVQSAESDALSQVLQSIWVKMLKLPDVAVDDDFFRLGGNSLIAARMMAQIKKETGKRLPLTTILRAPTIKKLVVELEKKS